MTVFKQQTIIENALSGELYAMYLRKSRADLELEAMGEEETLARHKKMLYNLAAKREIHPDQIVVYHELVSGDSIDERPEMQRLLSDVYNKKYRGVLVVEVERLARGNTKDQGEVADAFQYSNTFIITPAKVYDPQNEFDQEYFEFGLFMSRREYKTIRRRLESGKKESVEEGNYILPQRIFGFNIERRTKKDRVLVPNPDEVPILHMIFDWYTEENRSTEWIAQQLTAMGIPTTRNRPEWHRGTIRDMLCNVHYIGKVTWDNQRTVKQPDPVTGKIVKKRVQTGNPSIYNGKHDALISNEQFEKAQEITKANAKPPVQSKYHLKNPLSGLLMCCDCGGMMSYFDISKCPSRCNEKTAARFQHPRRIKCKKKSLPVPVVLEALCESLKCTISDYEMKLKKGTDNSELVKHQEIIRVMEAELSKQEKRKRKLMDSWESEDGLYTRDEFIERKRMYTDTIERLKEQIKEAKENSPAPVDYSEKITTLHRIIDCIQDPDIDADQKNIFLKQYIEKITYDSIDFGRNKGGKAILQVYLK